MSEPVAPWLSVTVNVTVYTPDARVHVRRGDAGAGRAVTEVPRSTTRSCRRYPSIPLPLNVTATNVSTV